MPSIYYKIYSQFLALMTMAPIRHLISPHTVKITDS